MTTRRSQIVVFDGQSLNNYPTTGATFPAVVMDGRGLPWVNVAISGQAWTTLDDTAAMRVDGWPKSYARSILVMTGGSSDILEGNTPAQALADMETYVDARRTAGFDIIIGATIPPGSLITASSNETDRLNFNTLLLASDFCDYLVDICVAPLLDFTDTTYWEADQNHWNAGGAAVGGPLYADALDSATA